MGRRLCPDPSSGGGQRENDEVVVSAAQTGPLMGAWQGGRVGSVIWVAREGGRGTPGGILSLTYLGPP